MSTLIGVRPLNRSAKVGLGTKDLVFGRFTYVNIDRGRVVRDLGHHASIGQFIVQQGARYQQDSARVSGGVVTPRANSLTLDIVPGYLTYQQTDATYTKDVIQAFAALTQAVTPDATLPKVVAIGLDTSTPATPAAVALGGTAAAAVTEARAINAYGGLPANPAIDSTANRTWLAIVWVPPTFVGVTGVASTGVFTTGTSHGYVVGDPVWFSAVTGATAGLTVTTPYFVNAVPSATTFTVSATLGGPALTWTTNVTSGTVQRQILAADVLDTRP